MNLVSSKVSKKIIVLFVSLALVFTLSPPAKASTSLLVLAGGAAAADGPLPIGDIVAVGILAYVAGSYVVKNWQKISAGTVDAYDGTPWNYSWNWLFKSEVDVSNRSTWTEVDSEDQVLEDNNAEIGATFETEDGMEKSLTYDKDTGKPNGQIHKGQPEYKADGTKTGKVFPPHFHKSTVSGNKITTGSHHYYW